MTDCSLGGVVSAPGVNSLSRTTETDLPNEVNHVASGATASEMQR